MVAAADCGSAVREDVGVQVPSFTRWNLSVPKPGNGDRPGYTKIVTVFPCSSAAERSTVNRNVPGSIPGGGAKS